MRIRWGPLFAQKEGEQYVGAPASCPGRRNQYRQRWLCPLLSRRHRSNFPGRTITKAKNRRTDARDSAKDVPQFFNEFQIGWNICIAQVPGHASERAEKACVPFYVPANALSSASTRQSSF